MYSDSSDDDPQISHFLRKMDLLETESSFIMKLDAPGVQFKDITIEFNTGINYEFKDQSMVIISVERRRLDPARSILGFTSLAEREFGRFSRKIFLPEGVDVTADPTYSTTNGVITVTVGKKMPYKLQYDELSSVYPRTDMVEFPDKLVYLMDLPGLVKEKVKVEIVELTSARGPSSSPALRITGKWERDFEGGILRSGSRRSHSLCRGYILPRDFEGARTENIQCEMKDGVLTVTVPKTTTTTTTPGPGAVKRLQIVGDGLSGSSYFLA